eukprot:Em0001g2525a
MRNVLKEQIEQVRDPHKTFVATVEESKQAAEVDKSWESHNQEQKKHHREVLVTYRDDNKKLIELKEQKRREAKEAQSSLERKILAQNPINWNHSLT